MTISVIIPVLNEAENIRRTIAAAQRGYSPREVEIIVVDGGSTDGTLDLIPEGVQLFSSETGRARQMNAGAAASHGRILVFCHGDTCLPPGWREQVIKVLNRPGITGGSFQIQLSPAQGMIHLLNRLWLPANWRIVFGDQVQFMWRSAYEQAGGFPEIPLMEDLEMARQLAQTGRLARVPLRVTSSSRRFLEGGPLRQFLLDVVLVIRYLYLKADPEELSKAYRTSRENKIQP